MVPLAETIISRHRKKEKIMDMIRQSCRGLLELVALNRDCRNLLAIIVFLADIVAASVGGFAGYHKFKKVHERMMPVCAAAAAAAPASSYGGGVVAAEADHEKYDCFAGNGFVVALVAAMLFNVVAHLCIYLLAGGCCHCRDDDAPDDHNSSERKTHRKWAILFECLTWLILVIGCIFLGAGVPSLEKKPLPSNAKVCQSQNTTAAYYDGRLETRVCSAAWLPAAGGVVVLLHPVFGLLYSFFARKLSFGRGSN